MIWKLLKIFLLLIPSLSGADSLIIGGLSNHSEYWHLSGKYLNEKHPAIGYEKRGAEITFFKNSLGRGSVSIAHIVKKNGYGIRLGAAKYGQNIIPVVQGGYFGKNYDITFGAVSTLIFKIPLEGKYNG